MVLANHGVALISLPLRVEGAENSNCVVGIWWLSSWADSSDSSFGDGGGKHPLKL